MRGYLDAMPADKRTEVSTYFGNMCRRASFELISNYNYNTDEPASDRIVNTFRRIFPENFLDCIDKNRFELTH